MAGLPRQTVFKSHDPISLMAMAEIGSRTRSRSCSRQGRCPSARRHSRFPCSCEAAEAGSATIDVAAREVDKLRPVPAVCGLDILSP